MKTVWSRWKIRSIVKKNKWRNSSFALSTAPPEKIVAFPNGSTEKRIEKNLNVFHFQFDDFRSSWGRQRVQSGFYARRIFVQSFSRSKLFFVSRKNERPRKTEWKHFLFRFFKVEAVDDDCSNDEGRVCGYKILEENLPFQIDSNGTIRIERSLNEDVYQFRVAAVDCQTNFLDQTNTARVTIKKISQCKPKLYGKPRTFYRRFLFTWNSSSKSNKNEKRNSVQRDAPNFDQPTTFISDSD